MMKKYLTATRRISGRSLVVGLSFFLILMSFSKASSASPWHDRHSQVNLSPESIPGDSMLRAAVSPIINASPEVHPSRELHPSLTTTLISVVKEGGVSIHF
jgi:hypothetical protein